MLRVLLILLAIPTIVAAASTSDDEIFNVDFSCGWGGFYRPMEWTPVEIDISSVLTEPFGGSVTIAAQQDGLNTMNVTYGDLVLTPNIQRYLPMVTKLAFAAGKCTVTIWDDRGRRQWEQDYNLWDYSPTNRLITPVSEGDFLIGLIGGSRFGMLRLSSESVCRSYRGAGKVYVGLKLPRMVPWDWTGFVPLDLLVLYDPDWSLFRDQQLEAIVQWVSNGGKLLVVLGKNQLPANNPIARFLPFNLQDVKQVTITEGILQQWDLASDERETVSAWSLVPKSGARYYEASKYDIEDCLFGTAHVGFGRVGVLAFDPSMMSERQSVRSARFWTSRIKEILVEEQQLSQFPVGRNRSRNFQSNRMTRSIDFSEDQARALVNSNRNQSHFEVGQTHGANNAVMEFLYQGIKPLSIWWVIILLTLLAILLGPVDYKFLKRKGRLPLTWLTCTFWIALFTVGAYYGVQAIRGGKMELRVVSVVDGIEDSDRAWSTNYCGLFAPSSDDYRLSGLQANQWWSGISPTQQSINMYNREVAGRKIYCFQHDGGNIPYSLPINIWTIQCLLNESSTEKVPFTAEVKHDGDEVVVSISNESESPILNAYVYLNNERGANLGPVPAGKTVLFNKKSRSMKLWDSYDQGRYLDYAQRGRRQLGNFRTNDAFFAQGSLQRTRAMSDYLARGAALVCAEYDQAPVSFTVEDYSCKPNHVQIARLVVFPK